MIYELRTYQIVEGRMDGNHKAFTDTIIPILQDNNVGMVGFWEQQGSNRRTFVYMLQFEDNAHKDRAWANFGEDSRWKEFLANLGDDNPWENTESVVLEPTGYSAMQ